jgi:hypothetical protein
MRLILGVLGAVTALFPDRVIDLFEEMAITNPGNSSTRSWFRSSIRAEGVLITVACLLGGRLYAGLMNLTGLFGAVVLLFPDVYRKIATTMMYEQPDQVEWNERLTPGVRIIGAVYLLVAIWSFIKRQADTNE